MLFRSLNWCRILIAEIDNRLHDVGRQSEPNEAGAGFRRGFGRIRVSVGHTEVAVIGTIGIGEAIGVGATEFVGAPSVVSEAACRRGDGVIAQIDDPKVIGSAQRASIRCGCLGRDHAMFRFRGADRWPSDV